MEKKKIDGLSLEERVRLCNEEKIAQNIINGTLVDNINQHW